VNWLDYLVLLGSMLGIAAYGMWRTRGKRDLQGYLKGSGTTRWVVIGLSVMATQASATTFISLPGQGYQSGLGFVQNYFGAPLGLMIIAAFFLPIYRRLNVYTAYEFLGRRFDGKTRLLGAALFLLQRGIGAGITIYAPAIVLSSVFGWRLDLTILCSGALVIAYTVAGGSEAVTLTQKYQFTVIMAGMAIAFVILLSKLPAGLTIHDALTLAGGFHKLQAVDYSPDLHRRYTFWSGTIGGMFLALSYFGTDQSQVQRYIHGKSLRESRLGLMFNAVLKIPMQFFIMLLGAMLFVFYQFQPPPVFFNQTAWREQMARDSTGKLQSLENQFAAIHSEKERFVQQWIGAQHSGDSVAAAQAKSKALADGDRAEATRDAVKKQMSAANAHVQTNDADYVFITFILAELPHGMIGLLVAAFFAAALSSKAGELNALGSTTTVDIYRHLVRGDASDAHYVVASKWFTVFWGLVALAFALFANLQENLIQAGNIVGSVFYGVPLAIFLVAFFLPWVGGTAIFFSGIVTQILVIFFYFTLTISYLWYNLIGCVVCVAMSLAVQAVIGAADKKPEVLTPP
jgi:solute:Na+ symporter, SSS family